MDVLGAPAEMGSIVDMIKIHGIQHNISENK